ncbi:MAG: 4-(cytidine 5'-diphospho)-2-C-methyl-D-erythritol kinase [Bacilli bacterium]|jgi:4-diphosphocytidyl-2C-methyl-D-erythritol kinase
MYIKAYAKINIALNVLGKDEDGYHQLDMVNLPLELRDSIEIAILPNSLDSFITCDDIEIEDPKNNLISVAIAKAREKYKFRQQFTIHVYKDIPISAGLAGGSANAAAVLNALFLLLKIKPTREEKIELAKSVGADVPFCMFSVPARVRGIGEIIEPIEVKKSYPLLIVKPLKGLSTTTVFNVADGMELKSGNIENVIQALADGDDDLLANSIHNALENPSFFLLPEIEKIKRMLIKDGLKIVLMSGSGSSIIALDDDVKKLTKLEKKYAKMGYDTRLTRTLRSK